MRNIKIYFLAIIGLIATACENELELAPPQDIDNAVALSSDANVKTVLIGAYDALGNSDLFGGNTLRNAELLAADGEIAFSGTFGDPAEIWRKEMTVINGDAGELWLEAYEAINITNNVLSALDVVNEEDKTRVEAEAKFIRGLVYFDLVLNFSQPYSAGNTATNLGVPIVTEPNSVEKVSRNTVDEVYAQVISDLSFALENLPADNGVYANSVAAAAVLSRVYLQQANYADARDAANRALTDADGIYFLNSAVEDAFNSSTNTPEDVFAIQVTTQDGANNMQLFFASTTNGGRGDIEVQQTLIDRFETGDDRLNLFYFDEATGDIRSGKWVNQFGNVGVIRLAELYLTRAEANFREGTTIGDSPANDLNLIRGRAGLTNIDNPTLDDILKERSIELALEGQKIHDAKRLKLTVDGFAYNANELVFPIPDRERNVNGNLEQNSGYGN
ncbi:RagB/SusD family nutrient uptake outer membrane protein [Flammeovirgaceae bacterium SG7u.111]|nr:RagB/SusD family nutrient uptake outer membrane protein [Flammeovirgaceae bacterium SG7u.132]WPO38213.1 RagB/SusD family nutrient uptake outer membrane protein [Flammeovirgaceae bacterium SG7u.111]